MNLENRFPKEIRGYRGKGRNQEGRERAKQDLLKRQERHPDGVVYFDTLPNAVRFVRNHITSEDAWASYSITAPLDEPGEFGYCAVAGSAGVAESVWAGRRLVVHEADLTKEVLDTFLDSLNTDTIEEV